MSARCQRLYGLFEKQPDGSWKRLYNSIEGRKDYMVRVCQSALLAHAMSGGEVPERRLMPLPGKYYESVYNWPKEGE